MGCGGKLRLLLWTIALARIARLDLALFPTHADGVFGLYALTRTPAAFWPLMLGMSIVLGSTWAHDVVYYGVDVRTLAVPPGIFAGTMAVLMLAPLLAFTPVLAQAKR